MTVTEIRNNLPKMVISVVKEAVMEGVRAHHRAQNEYNEQHKLIDADKPYSFKLAHAYYNSVRVASEVLYRIFESCSYDIQEAIKKSC